MLTMRKRSRILVTWTGSRAGNARTDRPLPCRGQLDPRSTGYAKNTVTKQLVEIGAACAAYRDEALHRLPATRIECDEIWSFVPTKAKNIPEERRDDPGLGDVACDPLPGRRKDRATSRIKLTHYRGGDALDVTLGRTVG